MKKLSVWDAVVMICCGLNAYFALTTPWIGAVGWIVASSWFIWGLLGGQGRGDE